MTGRPQHGSGPNEPDGVKVDMADKYGTLDWFVREYGNVKDDPWGLAWRPSQSLRYKRVLGIIGTITQPISSALDIGCATGDFTNLLGRRLPGLRLLVGVEFVESAVERARKRFPDITFVRESMLTVGERYEQQFDLVTCLEVLYYLEEDQRRIALKSLKKALRNGGYAVFSSLIGRPPHFSPDELRALIGSEFSIVRSDLLHLAIVNLLERAGGRGEKLLSGVFGPGQGAGSAHRFGRLPLPAVFALEKWSRILHRLSASHSIVLAKAVGS